MNRRPAPRPPVSSLPRRAATCALALSAGLGVWALCTRDAPRAPTSANTPAGESARAVTARATPYDGQYTLELEARQSLRLSPDAPTLIETSLALQGRLGVRRLPGAADALALTLDEVETVEARLGQAPLQGVSAVFEAARGAVVVARYTTDGVLTGLEFPERVGEGAQGMYQLLASTLQWSTAATEATRDEETPLGRVTARHALRTEGGRVVERLRERGRFSVPRFTRDVTLSLAAAESETRWTLDAAGLATGLRHAEHVRGVDPQGHVVVDDTQTLTLRRLGEALSLNADAAPRRAVGVGEVAPGADAEAQAMRDAAAGMTGAELVEGLLTLTGTGAPGEARFLFRAAALLTLHPELAARLPDVFARLPEGSLPRRRVLDLLAQVNTPEAQRALIAVLEGDTARRDPDYLDQFQRLALVGAPGPEVVRFAQAMFDEAPAGLDDAPAYMLGAVAGRLSARGDAQSALDLTAPLVERLDDAASVRDQAVVADTLRALGNAARPEHVARARQHADAADPAVRQAAAAAVRRVDTAEARALLDDLAADPHADVATEALRDLTGHALDGDDFAALARIAAATPLDAHVAEVLLNLLAEHAQAPGARPVLLILAGRSGLDGHLVARAEALLAARG